MVSAGERDPDAEDVTGMSASKLRKAAAEGDYDTFRSGLPKPLDDEASAKLYATIRSQMNIEEDFFELSAPELWEIAPKYDQKGLREQYVNGLIYRIGDIVESLHTGLVGTIIRLSLIHI